MWRSIVAAVGMLVATACVSNRPVLDALPDPGDALFAPEIVAARVMDAYQAVVRLRPAFLRGQRLDRGLGGAGEVEVYLDDVDLGGVAALHQVPLDAVTQIRYLSPMEAEMRWAGRHPGGVILVSTRRQPR